MVYLGEMSNISCNLGLAQEALLDPGAWAAEYMQAMFIINKILRYEIT